MDQHSKRTHAVWAASATARNWVCSGAISMCSMVEAHESEAAAWGTAAHEVADACLRTDVDPDIFLGTTRQVGRFTIDVDDEMVETVRVYVDYCAAEVQKEPGTLFWIEQKLSLQRLGGPLEAGGTGDFVLYRPSLKLLKVIDFKGGRGVFVDAKNNAQGRSYGIGAVLSLPDLDVEQVEVTIVQPRATRGDDGGVRSETFHVADLYEWTAEMLERMRASAAAAEEFALIRGNRVMFDEWCERWLTTGQCTFCDAKALCPKFRKEAMSSLPDRAQKWFDQPTDEQPPELSNAAVLMSPEELAHALNGVEMIEAWAKAVRERGHALAESGTKVPGWYLGDRYGNRSWLSEDAAGATLLQLGLAADKIFKQKLVTAAQAEKLLGAKRKSEIEDLWEKPRRGSVLLREGVSGKPEAQPAPQRHFEEPTS